MKDIYFYQDGRDKDFAAWYQLAGFLQMLVYLFICLDSYNKYRKKAYDTLSFAESVVYRWIQQFLLALLALLAIRMLYFIINPEWAEFGRKFWYYLAFSLLIYHISIHGFINAVKSGFAFSPQPPASPAAAIETGGEPTREVTTIASFDQYPDLAPSAQQQMEEVTDLPHWKKKIEELLEKERIFEDPLLTLAGMAGRLGEQPKKISRVINQAFATNFNDLVNFYRVQAVVRKMEAGEDNLHTILAIAFDCGFNSKSTFNRAFKKHTGSTPKELIRQKQEKLVSNPDLGPLLPQKRSL
ncbi:MAG: helix-turn-helix transcriptional regulator [Niastella sp.]|nr:helix-turn-helix transcriptional regulator [Niastella sp.]